MTPERIYKILLHLYPRDFREQYSKEMTRVFQENLQHEGSSFNFWIQVIWDVISSASREHISGGWNMQNVLVKVGGILAVIHGLVLPFIATFLATQKWEPTKPIDGTMLFTDLLFNGLLLPFIVVASFFHLSRPRSQMEYLGCFLAATTPLFLMVGRQLLIQGASLTPASWIGWMFLIGQFGLPVGLAIMGLTRVRQAGVHDAPDVSKIQLGIAVLLFITATIWLVVTSITLATDVIEPLGMTIFMVGHLAWLPLAWVLLTNQKPTLPSRAQPT
jgi:hypothetical protein